MPPKSTEQSNSVLPEPMAWNRADPSRQFYQTPQRRPLLERAEGVYLWDSTGKRYLDGCSGAMVSNIGHSNPRVLEAMRRQMDRATFGYRLHFENESAERLAAQIVDLCPPEHERVYFVSGGSEAVESCLKLARQYAFASGQGSRWKVISRSPSYHGSTLGALAVTGYQPLTAPFLPLISRMPMVPAPRSYLDRDSLTEAERGIRYANMLRDKIIDEVMSGAGRTGRFLAADHWQIKPDIIALAKGLAAGYAPLGAMLADERIIDPVMSSGGFQHGYTYAGNPLSCAAGLAVIQEILERDLMARARSMGDLLKRELQGLMDIYPFIGDVRGKGLLLAFELVENRDTMQPLPASLNAYTRLVELAYERGLIVYSRRTRDGIEGDHFMVCPPMICTPEHIAEIMEKLADSLDALQIELGLT